MRFFRRSLLGSRGFCSFRQLSHAQTGRLGPCSRSSVTNVNGEMWDMTHGYRVARPPWHRQKALRVSKPGRRRINVGGSSRRYGRASTCRTVSSSVLMR